MLVLFMVSTDLGMSRKCRVMLGGAPGNNAYKDGDHLIHIIYIYIYTYIHLYIYICIL